jgi:Ca2+-dependent lipid-binding protein
VKAAALRGIEQIAKPGDDKQFMEVEIEVFGASNLPKKDRFGACDGYVILTLKHPGEPDKEVGRTGIKWQELNPRWRQNFYIEIREPGVDSIEFSVWDEDGESDDICGQSLADDLELL